MIEVGSMTIIDDWPYRCVKIESGTAYLKRLGDETRGRMRQFTVKMCPYIDENKDLITPIEKKPKRRTAKKFDIMKSIRNEVEMSVSNDLVYFVREWLESAVCVLAHNAELNAIKQGDKRIQPRHWYWLDLGPESGKGVWPEQDKSAKEWKEIDWSEN
tara:strand:- start:8253 stop:8726 length:474 start_codon:yes stop_codon:yes gene_type:complete